MADMQNAPMQVDNMAPPMTSPPVTPRRGSAGQEPQENADASPKRVKRSITMWRVDVLGEEYFERQVTRYHDALRLEVPYVPGLAPMALLHHVKTAASQCDGLSISKGFCCADVDTYICRNDDTAMTMNVLVVDAQLHPPSTWCQSWALRGAVYDAVPDTPKGISAPMGWEFQDSLWALTIGHYCQDPTTFWAVTTSIGSHWYFGATGITDAHKTVLLSPLQKGEAAFRALIAWFSNALQNSAARELQSEEKVVELLPTIEPPAGSIPVEVPPPPPRISRILQASNRPSSARGTRSHTLARGGFVNRDENGEADFVRLSGAHLRAMRNKSLWLRPKAGWNSKAKEKHTSAIPRMAAAAGSSAAAQRPCGPTVQEAIQAYHDRQPSLSLDPEDAVEAPVLDHFMPLEKSYMKVLHWQQYHFGPDDDDLDGGM